MNKVSLRPERWCNVMFFIGIDVSKKKLNGVVLLDEQTLKKRSKTVPNTPEGHQQLVDWCRKQTGVEVDQWHAVMEATGPYHEALALALHQAGLRVSVINPKRLKDFAKGLGVKAKNDAVDALCIARFGAMNRSHLRLWQPESPPVRQLRALLRRLAALEKDCQREQNRLEKAQISHASKEVLESLNRAIGFLEQERQALIKLIDEHIERHPTLKQQRQHLQSIPGVGPVVSALMTGLFEDGQRFDSAPQVASFLGLFPTQHESGSSVHQRPHLSKSGPAYLRAKLYMATVSALRCNPDIQAFYDRLCARGKCKMAALAAAMRKLVHICFGVVKNQTEYQPQTPRRA